MTRPVLIAGPTASGKSALALRVAEAFAGVIINADSMQVYRDLRIITARPTLAEETQVPHRLYGHVDAAENYSAGRWLRDVQEAIAQTIASARRPIIVGGTGLYFKLLTSGLANVPRIPTEVRIALRARAASEGVGALHSELSRRDPVSAVRVHPSDQSRIVRALEVIEATGRTLSDWRRENPPPVLDPADVAKIFIEPERDALRMQINRRFEVMLEAGALEEARALASRNLDPTLPAMKAHGVPWLIRHLRGDISLEEATAQAKSDTRQYAKRQFTWFRNQLPDWPWESPARAFDRLTADLNG